MVCNGAVMDVDGDRQWYLYVSVVKGGRREREAEKRGHVNSSETGSPDPQIPTGGKHRNFLHPPPPSLPPSLPSWF